MNQKVEIFKMEKRKWKMKKKKKMMKKNYYLK